MATYRAAITVVIAALITWETAAHADITSPSQVDTVQKFLERRAPDDSPSSDGSPDGSPTPDSNKKKIVVVKLGLKPDLKDYDKVHEIKLSDGYTYVIYQERPDVISSCMTMLSAMLIGGIAAYIYKSKKEWPLPQEGASPSDLPTEDWSSGLFDCCQDPYSCACACCCLPAVWADTMDMAGLASYWPAWLLAQGLLACYNLPVAGALAGFNFILLIVMLQSRQQLRTILQLPAGGKTLCTDFFSLCCCIACTTSQQFRHVNLAAKLGHETVIEQRPIKT